MCDCHVRYVCTIRINERDKSIWNQHKCNLSEVVYRINIESINHTKHIHTRKDNGKNVYSSTTARQYQTKNAINKCKNVFNYQNCMILCRRKHMSFNLNSWLDGWFVGIGTHKLSRFERVSYWKIKCLRFIFHCWALHFIRSDICQMCTHLQTHTHTLNAQTTWKGIWFS